MTPDKIINFKEDIMNIVYFLFIFLLVFYKLSQYFEDSKSNGKINLDVPLPYTKIEYFFTKNEYEFFRILYEISHKYNALLFSKVRLADIIYMKNITKNNIKYWNKIKSKHVDFVICDSNNYEILFLIELDDSTHDKQNRIERDNFVDKTLETVKLPIFHIKVSDNYNINYLEELFKTFTNKNLKSYTNEL